MLHSAHDGSTTTKPLSTKSYRQSWFHMHNGLDGCHTATHATDPKHYSVPDTATPSFPSFYLPKPSFTQYSHFHMHRTTDSKFSFAQYWKPSLSFKQDNEPSNFLIHTNLYLQPIMNTILFMIHMHYLFPLLMLIYLLALHYITPTTIASTHNLPIPFIKIFSPPHHYHLCNTLWLLHYLL